MLKDSCISSFGNKWKGKFSRKHKSDTYSLLNPFQVRWAPFTAGTLNKGARDRSRMSSPILFYRHIYLTCLETHFQIYSAACFLSLTCMGYTARLTCTRWFLSLNCHCQCSTWRAELSQRGIRKKQKSRNRKMAEDRYFIVHHHWRRRDQMSSFCDRYSPQGSPATCLLWDPSTNKFNSPKTAGR